MYTTCLFCQGALGLNQVIEHFQVGTRFAFDGERGRFWVVCRKCERWNLTPLEERWEAIEDCERLFERTRLRMSTDNVGLAKLRAGVDLIRIGQPKRPEFAAWRYGDTFGRRRRTNLIKAGIGAGAVGALVVGGTAAGVGVGGFTYMLVHLAKSAVHGSPDKVVAKLNADGRDIKVRNKHLPHVRLHTTGPDGWALGVPAGKRQVVTLEGDRAMKAVGLLMPHINRFAGKRLEVDRAVDLLEREHDPLRYFTSTARNFARGEDRVKQFPKPAQLALEMAANEETERRAMEGELWFLERTWRDAEQIASIADNLLVPDSVEATLRKHKEARG
jgi:hypothetical protein